SSGFLRAEVSGIRAPGAEESAWLARCLHLRAVARADGRGLLRRLGRRRLDLGDWRRGSDGLQAINDPAQVAGAAFAFDRDQKAVERGLDTELAGRLRRFVGNGCDVELSVH